MLFKPFKPLSVKGRPGTTSESVQTQPEPPRKKRRISDDVDSEDDVAITSVRKAPRQSSGVRAPRRALVVVKNPPASAPSSKEASHGFEAYYNVLWRKPTAKMHKTWDGDGILVVRDGYASLQEVSGKEMGRTVCKDPLLPGSTLKVGGKDVEIDSMIPQKEYLSGRSSLGHPAAQPARELPRSLPTQALPKPVKHTSMPAANAPALSTSAKSGFKNPILDKSVQAKGDGKTPVPRHDPNAEGALVMKQPKTAPKGKQLVDVVVDPVLSKHLREHQREGVSFLYECVMGMRGFEGEGAILADEMGLGKTLQTIALLWTLLKQNPVHDEAPVIKKALIVCPVSLVNNWKKEFRKWLGNERIGVMAADNKTRLTDFTLGRSYSVMIIGYEKLRTVQQDLQKGSGIDIVIADEGHRLKTAQNKSAMAIRALNTERRIVLSGTPVQNDLSEFYTMVDLVNPGLLNKYTTFKRVFEIPIVKSRQPEASDEDIEKGQAKSEELAAITAQFILRRTSDILATYLPPKTEYVLFCRPTDNQEKVYDLILKSPVLAAALNNSEMRFHLINALKKVCNSPSQLSKPPAAGTSQDDAETVAETIISHIPSRLLKSVASGKLAVLDQLLHVIRSTSDEKVVLVSNYTSTMDVLANLLTAQDYRYLRLDGSTPASKRQDLVDDFNRTPAASAFVFLLSAKAGGLGLNLIGASRLVLFDIDWNPATDLQAMGRICRDGQTRPCWIYRLLTKGALDEKIFQRQMTKQGLADSVVDSKAGFSSFSKDELRDLFSLDRRPACQTHELLGCPCAGRGVGGGEVVDVDVDVDVDVNAPSPVTLVFEDELPDVPDILAKSTLSSTLGFLPSSQVDSDPEERQARCSAERRAASRTPEREKGKMRSLMQYSHIDTAAARMASAGRDRNVDDHDGDGSGDPFEETVDPFEDVADGVLGLDAAIEDDVLRRVALEQGSLIDYVFAKTAQTT